MNIAVLSGKGGTGKTFVSVNLAAAAAGSRYLDCDVEEPNGRLFFKPVITKQETVCVKVPVVDHVQCTGCRRCVDFCRFNALAYISGQVLVFTQLCHSCGGCPLVCPTGAISEEDKVIGTVEMGKSEDTTVVTGIMDPGEESGVAIIDQVLRHASNKSTEATIIDCPPGSSCTVMEGIKDADYCLLVAEPTLLSVHNLGMVWELVKTFNKPFGVVINKAVDNVHVVEDFCATHNINVLAKIPFDFKLADFCAKGLIACREDPAYLELFSGLLRCIVEEAQHETTANN
ncbi:MAG: 4Fe-4S binding protein [Firmicutes bacterium]|nr:ATP-binding protein [Bacillota bacterium]NLL89162.1 4Fe-4S binding protein [Bacillota bacterium]HKM17797.1 ATP-binding protein [Limnochordia bacterium]